MKDRRFRTRTDLVQETAALIGEHIAISHGRPGAVMLSGGQTPLPIYDRISRNPVPASARIHILLSDERMVPETSPDSNFGRISLMLAVLGIPQQRTIRVNTELPLNKAADLYDSQIRAFFKSGGSIDLAILGIGTDGHTASLFTRHDLERAGDRCAIAVRQKDGLDRVSVTPYTISRSGKVVILAVGKEKAGIVGKLQASPGDVIAGMAVAAVRNVELWVCGAND